MCIASAVRTAGVLVIAALLAACGSAGQSRVIQAKTEAIPAGKTVAVTVAALDELGLAEAVRAVAMLQQHLPAQLVADRVFGSVEASGSADYNLNVTVIEAVEVSPARRVWTGFFSGRSFVRAEVKLHDSTNNDLVSEFEATGQGSRNWTSAQGYGLDDPVRELVSQIVANLK